MACNKQWLNCIFPEKFTLKWTSPQTDLSVHVSHHTWFQSILSFFVHLSVFFSLQPNSNDSTSPTVQSLCIFSVPGGYGGTCDRANRRKGGVRQGRWKWIGMDDWFCGTLEHHVVMWFLHINLWHTLCWKFLPPEEKLVQFEKLSQDWFWLLMVANIFTLHYFDCFTMGFSFFSGGYSWRCWDFYECFTLNFHLL